METISLKALSLKVLHGNTHGNKMETLGLLDGNIEAKKEGKCFHSFHDGTMTETDIKKMPLSDFEKAGLILKVYSEVLQDHVYFISSEEAITRNQLDAVAYTPKELQQMLGMSPQEVQAAHMVKAIFHRARVKEHRRVAG